MTIRCLSLISRSLVISLCLCFLPACGKYAKPKPPEAYAPAAVNALGVTPYLGGVKFNWEAPNKDARNQELKLLEGYRVYRREVPAFGQASDPSADFALLAELPDYHLDDLMKRRQQAWEQGVPTKSITVDPERLKFEYTDATVQPGKRYMYQIVGINQGGVEGVVGQRIQVVFRGDLSEVTLLPYTAEDFAF